MFFAIGCSGEKIQPGEIMAVKCESITLDGRLDEAVWQEASWVALDVIYPTRLVQRCNKKQYQQATRAAVVWNGKGIYIAMVAEDFDIQGNKLVDNDWIWLEDVMEVFMAPVKASAENPNFHIELQVSPAGTIFAQRSVTQGWRKLPRKNFDVAVHVDGTLNNSAQLDKTFSCEWFVSWDTLRNLKLAETGYVPAVDTIPVKMRFASWDISIHSQVRLNRLSAPGGPDPHKLEYYRPLVLK